MQPRRWVIGYGWATEHIVPGAVPAQPTEIGDGMTAFPRHELKLTPGCMARRIKSHQTGIRTRHDTDLENTTPSLIGTQWAAPNYRRKAMTEQDDPELWKQTPTYTEYGDTVKIYRDGKLVMELTPEKDEESKEEHVKYERTAK
jgi:hypothetical protein